jgi:exonuclease VII large subunit
MSQQPNSQFRTIRDTNALIRALVEQETLGYPFWVGGYVTRGFISDFGHIYFDLTDDDHTISCMIREQVRGSLDFEISNGMVGRGDWQVALRTCEFSHSYES